MQIESNSLERHAVAKNNIEETNIVIGKGSYGSVSSIKRTRVPSVTSYACDLQ